MIVLDTHIWIWWIDENHQLSSQNLEFTLGQGDYTRDRHQWLDQTPLEDILTTMKQHQENNLDQYDEVID